MTVHREQYEEVIAEVGKFKVHRYKDGSIILWEMREDQFPGDHMSLKAGDFPDLIKALSEMQSTLEEV